MHAPRHARPPARRAARAVAALLGAAALTLGPAVPTTALAGQGQCASATNQNSACASHGHALADATPPTNGGNGAGQSGQCTGDPADRPAVCPAT
jgi:hypothetical protein